MSAFGIVVKTADDTNAFMGALTLCGNSSHRRLVDTNCWGHSKALRQCSPGVDNGQWDQHGKFVHIPVLLVKEYVVFVLYKYLICTLLDQLVASVLPLICVFFLSDCFNQHACKTPPPLQRRTGHMQAQSCKAINPLVPVNTFHSGAPWGITFAEADPFAWPQYTNL